MSDSNLSRFYTIVEQSLENSSFIKMVLSNKQDKKTDLRMVIIKPISIKRGLVLNFVYRYSTKDITKNLTFEEGHSIIQEHLHNNFRQAELITTENNWHLSINKKNIAKLKQNVSDIREQPVLAHDKQKSRIIHTEKNIYLNELGVTTSDWKVKTKMQDKYKQINKYIEIIDGILKTIKIDSSFEIVDMGAGKGYLTFALYDYLSNNLKKMPAITGVELRKELVDSCNKIAQKANFQRLKFKTGAIKDVELPKMDMLIALHACDTATDDAIFRGITSNSKVIICAPCCHKQIRKQIKPTNDLSLITHYGILKERLAELITDSIRALILEAFGYKTKVFEFIATEHTPKNVLIVGVKHKNNPVPNQSVLQQINNIKAIYGVEYHYLEKMLNLVS